MASMRRERSPGAAGVPIAQVRHRRTHVHRALAVGAVTASAAMALAFGAPANAAVPAEGTGRTLLSVQGSTTPATVAAWVTSHGGTVVAVYDVADALLVTLPAGLALPAGTVAVNDVPLHVNSASNAAADVTGATYRATLGAGSAAQGAGVTVAVVDTGVADVADLAGRVEHVNVSGGPAGDGLGHGTFMAGLVAGDGSSSGGTYTGVAPQARVLDVQVADADGSTSLSKVIAGLQAVADAAATDGSVRVVSLALSTGSPLPPSVDPLSRALDRLWVRGLTVVVAAGNDGPTTGTVTSPGNDATLITVGALDEHGTSVRSDDDVADFSSRGTAFGNTKPDVVAPGVSLVSTRAPGSAADVANPASRVGDAYFTGSGTSMSEAVAAGAAAVLIGSRSALTPDSVKKLMTGRTYTSSTLGKDDGAGKGALDLAAALKAAPKVALLAPSAATVKLAASSYGPSADDAAAWQQFGEAWAAGDLEQVAAIWVTLSEQTRRWAATAFALSLVSTNAGASDEEFAAIQALAHRWATQAWSSRAWADDAFVAHRWADADWAAHRWALADWSAHRWAETDWSAHRWASEAFDAHRWAADAWDAHRWADTDWLAFAWVAHRWASDSWAADAWTDQDWSAHRWAAHRWADFAWSAHRWAADGWSAHRWAVQAWTDAAALGI